MNFAAYDSDREEVLERAREAGVVVINVGTQKDTSLKAIELAQMHDGVYAIVGIHPIHTDKSFHDEKEFGPSFASASAGKAGNKEFISRGEIFDIELYRNMAKHPKVVAVGECGLDYYRFKNHDSGFKNSEEYKKQEETFRKHIELAISAEKPLMLHVRNGSGKSAYRDALSILKNYSEVKADFHFFAGSWDEAKEILNAGFYLSFTGVITFARDYDEVIKNAPLDRIMTETDCPYVSPAPYRGKRNEPLYVMEVVKAISLIKGEKEDKVRSSLYENAKNFFQI